MPLSIPCIVLPIIDGSPLLILTPFARITNPQLAIDTIGNVRRPILSTPFPLCQPTGIPNNNAIKISITEWPKVLRLKPINCKGSAINSIGFVFYHGPKLKKTSNLFVLLYSNTKYLHS
ncbi:hypothetical protein MYP_2957 [Sporocytophaga myxococcoides]|uniref:Uncharacterized protein n=1 Tax=Sporocytophaga myxococcoides TaxID=153721 RepID=A0A098LIB0_9BACT|nr:hypothetical protein MYP_2957 [Sporocytophaga myxococcoides]